ncbi:hypothetical protein P7C70_g5595, partial [Phenoliferia sp. Uapishka_3]
MNLSSLIDQAKDAFYALAGGCYATLKLNGRSFKILKLLGEGGFSYVYLAQDLQSGRLFALKKIRCPLGSDSVRTALKEVEGRAYEVTPERNKWLNSRMAAAYKRFRHPNIIRCLDSCVVQDPQEDGKIIYLFLPYYKNATVQHVNGTRYAEREMLTLFLGTCNAVRAMHKHTSGPPSSYPPPSPLVASSASLSKTHPRNGAIRVAGGGAEAGGAEEEEDDDEHGIRGEGEDEVLIAGGGLESVKEQLGEEGGERTEVAGKDVPWAHRDIKPANVMIADDGILIFERRSSVVSSGSTDE